MDKVVVDVISIVIICITLCFLLLAIPFNLKEDYEIKGIGKFIRFTKNNSKYKRIAYVIYPFLAVYILFYISFYHASKLSGDPDWFFSSIYSLTGTVKSFVFETDLDPIELLFKENILYRIAWLITYPYALLFVYITIINAVTDSLRNSINVKRKLKKSCDIVLGINELDAYIENNKNVIVWVNPDISKDDELTLKAYKIPYIKKDFSLENLNKLKFKVNENNEYHFVSFSDENTNLKYISIFERFISQDKEGSKLYMTKAFFMHAEISVENIETIQDKIAYDHKELSPYIDLFNRYKLLSIKFVEENPITKYLSKYIDSKKAAIINEKEEGFDTEINVIYLGFGKVNKELYKASIMNDQIPSYNLKTKELKNHIINYYAFDKSFASPSNKNEIFYRHRYEYSEIEYEGNEYFEKPERVCKFVKTEKDLNDESIYEELINIVNGSSKSYTSIVISLQEDLYNIDYALKVVELFKELNIDDYHIFVRISRWNEEILTLLKDENISFFGWNESVLNHEVIVNEELMKISKLTNSKYANKRLVDTSWYDLDPIKQKSNIYSSLNLRLKLNLLGFDYEKVGDNQKVDNSKLLEELESKIKFNYNEYNDYLYFENGKEIVPAQVIAFQEHSRWNSFYISKGYVPFKIENIKLINAETQEFKKDDNKTKRHACITTYKGLNDYHHHLAELLSKENGLSIEDNLPLVETYKYDFNLMDSFNKIFKDNYLLKKIK